MALMGDIPFGVSYYSAEMFSRAQMNSTLTGSVALLRSQNFQGRRVYTKMGTKLGHSAVSLDVMRANNLQWWRARVSVTRRIFHLFRIDHVMGFYRIYSFPWRPESNKEFLPLNQQQMLELNGGRAPHFVPRDDDTPEPRVACKGDKEVSPRYPARSLCCARGRRRSRRGARLRAPESAIAWDCRIQDSPVGNARWNDHSRRDVRAGLCSDLRNTRSPTNSRFVERSAIKHSELRDGTTSARDTREDRALCLPTPRLRRAGRIEFQKRPAGLRKRFFPAAMAALFRCNSWIAIVMITDLLARNIGSTSRDKGKPELDTQNTTSDLEAPCRPKRTKANAVDSTSCWLKNGRWV